MTFPTSDAHIYRNEAGEPVGWDRPAEPPYCDICGYHHAGPCPMDDGYVDLGDDEPECENDEGEVSGS